MAATSPEIDTSAMTISAPYTKIVGIEMDYEHFGTTDACIEFLREHEDLFDVTDRKGFKLTVGSRSYHLRRGQGKIFQFYDGLAEAVSFTTYRPSEYCIVIKQLGRERWTNGEMPPKSKSELERDAKDAILRKEKEEKRKLRKVENEKKRKEKAFKQRQLYAKIKAQILASEGEQVTPPSRKKRKQVILEIPRHLLDT